MYPDPNHHRDEYDEYWEDVDVPETRPPLVQRIGRWARELVLTIVQAVVLAVLVIYFVAQATVVHGQSMEPNLHPEQRLIIEKLSYRFYVPERGDVVVLKTADSDLPLIKRVVGLPGETIEVRGNQVFINGSVLTEPYLPTSAQPDYPLTPVPEGNVFVMGDNRGDSRDSRVFGPVPINQIMGHAWITYWPLEEIGLVQ